ncbi:MAG: glycosyltransferase [Actinomycetota bacterium]|nr:glycosyltransferase [Actinomycetota bacterium]
MTPRGGPGTRVLHVIKGLGPGGAERLLVSLAGARSSREGSVDVAYLLPWKRHLVRELEEMGVATHLIGGRMGMADPRWPARLRQLVRTLDADVVHLHSPAVAAVARPTLRAMRHRPIIVSTEHNVWPSHGAATRWANAATLLLEDATFAVSDEVVRSAGRFGGRMETVVHGVPLASLARRGSGRTAARKALGVGEGDVLAVTVANLRDHKDYPSLFAAATIATTAEPRLRFVAIGQGPLEEQLRAELARTTLGDRFRMLGFHPDPAAVVAGADIFVLASTHEGLPIALLEAMALGVPPVATDVGGVPEVVVDGRDGVLVPPSRPDLLAAAIVDLVADAERRTGLAQRAAERAGAFDIANAAARLQRRYEALAAGRPTRP